MATKRPRGFIEYWNPREDTLELVEAVKGILYQNRDIAPLTLRQIFYMLVSGYSYDKTERAYKRLCETMNKARRAKFIDMDDIRDDGKRSFGQARCQRDRTFARCCRQLSAQMAQRSGRKREPRTSIALVRG